MVVEGHPDLGQKRGEERPARDPERLQRGDTRMIFDLEPRRAAPGQLRGGPGAEVDPGAEEHAPEGRVIHPRAGRQAAEARAPRLDLDHDRSSSQ